MAVTLRRLHRWLALILGIQLLAWVAGGIYFSWTDLDWIHGEHLIHKPKSAAAGGIDPETVAAVLGHLRRGGIDTWRRIDVIDRLGRPVLRVRYRTPKGIRTSLFSADGHRLPPLDRDQARRLAEAALVPDAPVSTIDYLTVLPPGHEYRGHPLPAWAVHFDAPGHPTVYVGANEGTVTAIRHDGWRVFDFLWMLHTLDFVGRDDIDNPWLRGTSLAALTVVMSGYGLYLWGRIRRRRRR